MAPKRATPKSGSKRNSEWMNCAKCETKLLSRDEDFHSSALCRTLKKIFIKNEIPNEYDRNTELAHGFIRNGIIFGSIIHKKIEGNDIF